MSRIQSSAQIQKVQEIRKNNFDHFQEKKNAAKKKKKGIIAKGVVEPVKEQTEVNEVSKSRAKGIRYILKEKIPAFNRKKMDISEHEILIYCQVTYQLSCQS